MTPQYDSDCDKISNIFRKESFYYQSILSRKVFRLQGRLIMTSTRTKHEHWLIGAVTSVLKEEFITRDLNDKSMDLASSLPFSGPLQLPTKMQALKLFWFFKDEIGRYNNWSLTKGDLEGIVARIVIHYWRNLAAYDTVDPSTAQRQVKRLVDLYQKLQKKTGQESTKSKQRQRSLPR